MPEAYVRGAVMAPFGHTPDRSLEDLVHPPIVEAVQEAGLEPGDIEAIFGGSYASGVLTAQRAVRGLGLSDRPIVNVENACASSSFALHQAVTAVRDGHYRNVLVLGVEQLSRHDSSLVPLNDDDPDVQLGLVMPAMYAMRAKRHQHEHGTTDRQLALVSVKSHANGALNPYARFQEPVRVDQVLDSRMIAEPLTLLQCCAGGDGAAALVVSANSGDAAPIRVAASAVSAGLATTGPRDMAASDLTAKVSTQAYDEASLGPEDLDVIELHDAFTVAELIYYEALGLCGRGEAGKLIEQGTTNLDGSIPVNPSGGLLSRGHPVGATGAAQAVEITWQLQGRADARQVDGPRVGLTHTTGGGIAEYDHGACAVHIFVHERGNPS